MTTMEKTIHKTCDQFQIKKGRSEDYPEIMKVWESSVKATHHFLKPEDFEFYKRLGPTDFLPSVDLYTLRYSEEIVGFIGVANKHLEMLFVEATSIGKGYGKALLNFAIEYIEIKTVDVNAQNKQALAFYEKAGFGIIGRSEKDAMGKDYPILHLELIACNNKK